MPFLSFSYGSQLRQAIATNFFLSAQPFLIRTDLYLSLSFFHKVSLIFRVFSLTDFSFFIKFMKLVPEFLHVLIIPELFQMILYVIDLFISTALLRYYPMTSHSTFYLGSCFFCDNSDNHIFMLLLYSQRLNSIQIAQDIFIFIRTSSCLTSKHIFSLVHDYFYLGLFYFFLPLPYQFCCFQSTLISFTIDLGKVKVR